MARPFDAECDSIILRECDFCYHCGVAEVTVRRIKDSYLVWFYFNDKVDKPLIACDKVFVFDRTRYELCVGGKSTELQEFDAEDFAFVFSNVRMDDSELALYTIPELVSDSMGKQVLRLILGAISKSTVKIETCDSSECKSLRIGLDTPGIPEVTLHFCRDENRTCMRFADNPTFPIWFSLTNDEDRIADLVSGIFE